MRTNIEIDDTLLHQAMQTSGAPTKKAVVDTALRLPHPTPRPNLHPPTPGKINGRET